MATFLEELWNSVFTPGTTPTLLIATNASFAALQFLLLILLLATHSIHFVILSILSGGLWYAINWFAHELQTENTKAAKDDNPNIAKDKSIEADSDTETESPTAPPPAKTTSTSKSTSTTTSSALLQPDIQASSEQFRRRRSLGDSSGYVSTDSEWEKVSEDDKSKR